MLPALALSTSTFLSGKESGRCHTPFCANLWQAGTPRKVNLNSKVIQKWYLTSSTLMGFPVLAFQFYQKKKEDKILPLLKQDRIYYILHSHAYFKSQVWISRAAISILNDAPWVELKHPWIIYWGRMWPCRWPESTSLKTLRAAKDVRCVIPVL